MNNICLYTESTEPSGMGRLMLILAAELRSYYNFSFVCPPSAEGNRLLKEAAALGLTTYALSRPEDFHGWLSMQSVDVLHNHAGIGWEGHSGVHIAHGEKIPVVRTEHLPYLITDEAQKAEHQQLMGLVERLVCVSKGVHHSFLTAGIAPNKLSVVQNGIIPPISNINRQKTRQKLLQQGFPIPVDAPLFLSVGRFAEQKNYDILLHCIPIVLQKYPTAQWLLVGTGPLLEDKKRLVEELNLTHCVHFTGSRNDVPDLMQASDALVVPSLFEGLPLIVLEAMALHLPVIGSDVCGIAETVRDGVTGRLVPLNDVSALAAAMRELLNDRTLATTWSATAYKDFQQHWTAKRMAIDMQKVYREVMGVAKIFTLQPERSASLVGVQDK